MNLNFPIIVFADKSLALIEMKQRGNGMKNRGVDFNGTDFAAVARAMGGEGKTVDSRNDLKIALEKSLTAKTFTVIACPISRKAYEDRI